MDDTEPRAEEGGTGGRARDGVTGGTAGAVRILGVALGSFVVMVAIIWIALWIILSRMDFSELGTTRSDTYAENVTLTAERPFAARVVTGTIDPDGDDLRSVEMILTLQTNVSPEELWLAAIDAETGAPITQTPRSPTYHDDYEAACLTTRCSQAYVLVACWLAPSGPSAGIYVSARLVAENDEPNLPRAIVAVEAKDSPLPDVIAQLVSEQTDRACP
jgi:hypothetical protein